uniref:Uncharacterized protein n=1 Tax=Lotharella globosa TaxID=91324 RepID=A0A7S3YM09_9EUKA|mmetsp:Transcript_23678/g.46166  ORF Transcript_23678/g.46166 Transcript_23678/m.46166 type:complete len:151 (+) Transcript_23678:444-896(+)
MFILGVLSLAYWDRPTGITLLAQASFLLWVHSIYSIFKYYGTTNIPRVSSYVDLVSDMLGKTGKIRLRAARKISVVCGVAAQAIIFLWFFGVPWLRLFSSGAFIAFLGLAHFYLMEVDYKGSPKVRPFGMIPFLLAPALAAAAIAQVVAQ